MSPEDTAAMTESIQKGLEGWSGKYEEEVKNLTDAWHKDNPGKPETEEVKKEISKKAKENTGLAAIKEKLTEQVQGQVWGAVEPKIENEMMKKPAEEGCNKAVEKAVDKVCSKHEFSIHLAP